MRSKIAADRGFTMIELLLAMAVFSFLLVVTLSGYLQLMRVYQSGLASREAQQNGRNIVDGIEQIIRTSGGAWTAPAHNTLCVESAGGVMEYSVWTFTVGTETRHDLYRREYARDQLTQPNCPVMASTAGWERLNNDTVDVQLFQTLTTDPVAGTNGTAQATLGLASRSFIAGIVVHRDPVLPYRSYLSCPSGTGSQFCAGVTLNIGGTLRGGL